MALSIRGRPIRFSLAWLKPPPMPADGNMTLVEHLRELRYRLVIIAVTLLVATIAAYVFHEQLYALLMRPLEIAKAAISETHPKLEITPTVDGVTAGFSLVLKTCLIAALVASSPIWLYQIWAFIVPGLMAKEKKWTLIFLSAAVPLFLLGVLLAYLVIPKGMAVLIGFTPGEGEIQNLLETNAYLSFLIRVMIVFGVGFELPVFVLALHFMGIVTAKQLAKARSFVIFFCFVFGAVATPQTDPLSMLLLASPMAILYVIAEIIARLRERAMRRRGVEQTFLGGGGVEKDRALAELEGRDLDAEEPGAKQTMAELLGLDTDSDSGSKSSRS